jgi:hypothetical protein
VELPAPGWARLSAQEASRARRPHQFGLLGRASLVQGDRGGKTAYGITNDGFTEIVQVMQVKSPGLCCGSRTRSISFTERAGWLGGSSASVMCLGCVSIAGKRSYLP